MNQRIFADVFYVNGVPIPASYFQAIDAAQSHAIDWDTGGTWDMAGLIGIGGSGIWLCGASAISSGSVIANTSGSGVRVVLGANDMIGLSSGHTSATRTIYSSCGQSQDGSALTAFPTKYSYGNDGAETGGGGGRFFVPLRVHNGGTFDQAVLTVNTAGGRAALPTSQPKMRIVGVGFDGIVIPLKTTTGAELGGWVQLAIGSVGSYNSQTLTLTYTCDADLIVDESLFGYVAEIVDESGTHSIADNVYTSVACTFTDIPNLGFS